MNNLWLGFWCRINSVMYILAGNTTVLHWRSSLSEIVDHSRQFSNQLSTDIYKLTFTVTSKVWCYEGATWYLLQEMLHVLVKSYEKGGTHVILHSPHVTMKLIVKLDARWFFLIINDSLCIDSEWKSNSVCGLKAARVCWSKTYSTWSITNYVIIGTIHWPFVDKTTL